MKIRLLYIGLILSLAIQLGLGQNNKSSGYFKSKSLSTIDVPALLQKARAVKVTNPQKAITYIEGAVIAAKKQKRKDYEAKCYHLLGDINRDVKQWEIAIQNYSLALALYPKVNKKEDKEVLFQLAECEQKYKHYKDALEHYLLYQKKTSSQAEQFRVQTGLGDLYYKQYNYTAAEIHYTKALAVAKNLKKKQNISIAKANLAKIYANQQKTEEAEELLEDVEISSKNNFYDGDYQNEAVQEAKEEVANQYEKEGRIEKSIAVRKRMNTNQAPEYRINQNQKVAETYLYNGEVDKAIVELKKNIVLAEANKLEGKKAEAHKVLSEALNKKGETKKALEEYKKYIWSKDVDLEQKKQKTKTREDIVKRQKNFDFISKDYEIYETEEELLKEQNRRQGWIIYSLLTLLILVLIASILIYRSASAKHKANQMLALKSLRSQMNPHFIFNALNSVNSFISKNDERSANKFLAEFSRLMRMVLNNSKEEFISLQEEMELITLYLKLEHYRFRDKFDYTLEIDSIINLENTQIPPMLIQPFIENAVWHGLRYKKEFGMLNVKLSRQDNGSILVEIKDNGVGRQKSLELKTANQQKDSQGLKNTQERVKLINKLYKTRYTLSIEDLDISQEDVGTCIVLVIKS